MRIAHSTLLVVALAGCGGGSRTSQPIGNETPAPAWTVERVFETVSPDAGFVIFVDVDKLKANPLVAGLGDQIEQLFAGQAGMPCDDLTISGSLVAVGSMPDRYEVAIWGLGGPTQPWRDCLVANAQAKGMQIAGDGDYLTTAQGDVALSYLFVDHQTVVMIAAPQTLTRADLLARTQPREGGAGIPEMEPLRRSAVPIWVAAHGASRLFAPLPMKFRSATLTIDVTDLFAVDASMALAAPDQATALAQVIQQQAEPVQSMGFISGLDVHAAGESVVVHAEVTKASLDKFLGMARSMTGRRDSPPAPGP
jgi:hypothetical protein